MARGDAHDLLASEDPEFAQRIANKYKKLDANRDGQLNRTELSVLLRQGNPNMSDGEIASLWRSIDSDGSGKVDFLEFVHWVFSSQPALTGKAQTLNEMTKMAREFDMEVELIELDGAHLHPEINGVYDRGEEINGKPTFDRLDPPAVIFYGWTTGDCHGWFVAQSAPENGAPVDDYLMFNPSVFAKSPEKCCAIWNDTVGRQDKRMVLAASSKKAWDSDCLAGACLPEELFGEAEEEALVEMQDLELDSADSADHVEQQAEDGDWESEWADQIGESIKANLTDEKIKSFVDPDFPPTDASVGFANLKEYGWTRLSEMHDKACLFQRVVPENVHVEDNAPNQWFVQACTAVAEYPAWIQSMIGATNLSSSGKYTVRLYHPGKKEFVNVIVDDFVPTEAQAPVFSGISMNGEIWLPLVEKAFAKLNASYKNMARGTVAYGLWYLCGGAGAESWERHSGFWKRWCAVWKGKANDTINRKRAEGTVHDGNEVGPAMLWLLLRQYMELCYPVTCFADQGMASESNLRTTAVYSIIGAREVKLENGKLRMVRMRNSFGKTFYTGRWSDSSDAWLECPAAVNQLKFEPKNDGTFWMSYNDFLRYIDHIDCVKKSMPVQGCRAAKVAGARRGLAMYGISDDW
mmetsp:Transcript_34085/g.89871  ORF Transcript_34085/g.89871 Transcript_34085/m.89871 type:complete len:635 (-) Transcript_34085:33-1937(-)